ncbi:MAG: YceH family protein [Acidobacteriota bacterium]|nr:YceH family protein [Acidobacteriota bacterium]
MILNSIQVRVLGGLIEKEITTPEAYPLSLNGLLNACNQRSSREPVMELDEEQVRQALHGLEEMALVSVARDARVSKFEHRARTVLNLRRDETALLCLLLLRGPQTPGELRSRADRLYAFDGLEAVESTLNRMASSAGEPRSAAWPGALAVLLPRQPGAREARWLHLLGGAASPMVASPPEDEPGARVLAQRASDAESGERTATLAVGPDTLTRVATLEAEVARLRKAMVALEAKLAGEA